MKTKTLKIKTKGNTDILDITSEVEKVIEEYDIKQGLACIFVTGSTAAVTTIEYEPGLIKDMEEFFEDLIPKDKEYHHNKKWHDDNGHSHLRASLLSPSLVIPITNSKMTLGTWQQIVLIDFDNKSRQRELIIKLVEG